MIPHPPGTPAPPPPTTGPPRWQSPAGRHRDNRRFGLGRLLLALVTALAVVSAGGFLAGTELDADERFGEFVITGTAGEWVPANTFTISVRAVRTAARIGTEPGAGIDTAGVWVLARVQAMAAGDEAVWLGYSAVRDSAGRSWTATDRIGQPLTGSGYRLDPGIPVEAEIAFEVPRDAATDLTLRIAEPRIDLRLQAVVEIPLAVDEAMVASGLALAEPLVIESPKVVIADPQVLVGMGESGR